MINENVTHPSFGLLSISKFSGGSSNFFGSSIEHSGGIFLTIKTADWVRKYNTDQYYGNKDLIKVKMSYNQFAEVITSGMNTSGVPCTIEYIDGKRIEQFEFKNKRLEFENDFDTDMKKISDKLLKSVEQAEDILNNKKTPTKAEKQVIVDQLKSLKMELSENIPFMNRCFNKAMDSIVVEAKSEIDGFYETKIRDLGLDVIEDLQLKKPKMIEDK